MMTQSMDPAHLAARLDNTASMMAAAAAASATGNTRFRPEVNVASGTGSGDELMTASLDPAMLMQIDPKVRNKVKLWCTPPTKSTS